MARMPVTIPVSAQRLLLSLVLAVLLAACGSRGGYYQDDGPPRRPQVDPDTVPDAVPRREPHSRTGNRPYQALGKTYYPMSVADGYRERGVASWYGRKFHGKRTSSGETYNMYAMTAAHRTLPLPSYVRVQNLRNGREVIVKVNDRGPFLHNRVIDLSYVAAHKLGIVATGTGLVEVNVVPPGGPTSISRATTVAASPRGDDPLLYVQFGAFALRDNAESMRRRLRGLYTQPVRVTTDRDRLYRVRLGPMSSVEAADDAIGRAQHYGYDPLMIIE
jgi:rare lipoprotein A